MNNNLPKWKEKIEKRLDKIEDEIEKIESTKSFKSKKTDLEEFVEKYSPSNYHELSVVVGYYIDRITGESFTMKDLNKKFNELRWGSYSNYSALESKLLDKDWIMEAEKDSHFIFHDKGIKAIKNDFD